jgi:hypothetical protein
MDEDFLNHCSAAGGHHFYSHSDIYGHSNALYNRDNHNHQRLFHHLATIHHYAAIDYLDKNHYDNASSGDCVLYFHRRTNPYCKSVLQDHLDHHCHYRL